MAQLKRDIHRYTYGDYLTWTDGPDSELVNGIAYVREPPAPAVPHQGIVIELGRQAGNALLDTPCRVYVAPVDVRLPSSNEPDEQVETIVQPDVLIVCNPQKIDVRGVRGAPDWIAEVLSPNTAKHDRTVKLPAYERAGVREVWLVHPIELRLAIYRLEGGRYRRPTLVDLKGKTPLKAVPDVTIDWDQALAKIW